MADTIARCKFWYREACFRESMSGTRSYSLAEQHFAERCRRSRSQPAADLEALEAIEATPEAGYEIRYRNSIDPGAPYKRRYYHPDERIRFAPNPGGSYCGMLWVLGNPPTGGVFVHPEDVAGIHAALTELRDSAPEPPEVKPMTKRAGFTAEQVHPLHHLAEAFRSLTYAAMCIGCNRTVATWRMGSRNACCYCYHTKVEDRWRIGTVAATPPAEVRAPWDWDVSDDNPIGGLP